MNARTPSSLELSVGVPVRNEVENIEPLVNEIRAALAGRAYEIAQFRSTTR